MQHPERLGRDVLQDRRRAAPTRDD